MPCFSGYRARPWPRRVDRAYLGSGRDKRKQNTLTKLPIYKSDKRKSKLEAIIRKVFTLLLFDYQKVINAF